MHSNGIVFMKMLAFNSDTFNTMQGQQNGVLKYLKEQQPKLVDFGCIWHLDNLTVKAAMKTLPSSIDGLLLKSTPTSTRA